MKAKVLVVDDEKDIRELIKFYLNKEGFEVLEAGDGEEALEIFENEYIDLGIIDVMMPVMDGFELVENLKEFKDIPVFPQYGRQRFDHGLLFSDRLFEVFYVIFFYGQ